MKTDPRDDAPLLLGRREALIAAIAAGAAVLVPRTARAAFDYSCNWQAGFAPPLRPSGRIGYITDFAGIGLPVPLIKDLTVPCAWNGATAPAYSPVAPSNGRVNVVGILDRFDWSGVATDPMTFSAYVSTENSTLLTSIETPRPSSAGITALGFWIVQYDPGTKAWFEQAYPSSPLRFPGQLPASANSVTVADEPVKIASIDDVGVWKITFVVVPLANQATTLRFASSPTAFTTASFGVATPAPPKRR
jgi:hypothetical protein